MYREFTRNLSPEERQALVAQVNSPLPQQVQASSSKFQAVALGAFGLSVATATVALMLSDRPLIGGILAAFAIVSASVSLFAFIAILKANRRERQMAHRLVPALAAIEQDL